MSCAANVPGGWKTGLLAAVWLGAFGHDALAASSMRAAVIVPGGIRVESVPIPEPQPGQVRIKVRAASVNPVDWKLAEHADAASRTIPGKDLSGVIDAVGPSAGPWKAGEAVIAIPATGSYAEYALASANTIAQKPRDMSFDEAAGLPVVGETAWRAIVTVAGVKVGQQVLILGGAGGVGSAAVQIAKSRGAHVIATASPRHDKLLRSLGADEVIDYNSVRFEDKVKNLDVVVNTVDSRLDKGAIGVIRPGGILVSVVGQPSAQECAAARIRCEITGRVNGQMLGSVVELANAGKLHVAIERRLPLADAAAAWNSSRAGHVGGKIILIVSH